MPIIAAVGTSLVAVTAFGLTTAINYACSGLVDWPLAGAFIAGGVLGSIRGTHTARRVSASGHLTAIFAATLFAAAAYALYKSVGAL